MTKLFSPGERVPSTVLADPQAAIRGLRAAWEAYQEDGLQDAHVRSAIVNSWSRSREYSVSPDRRAADIDAGALAGFDSRDQTRRLLTQVWRTTKTQLSDALSGSDSAVVICDDAGHILDRGGDPAILRSTEIQNFVPGSDWSEEGAGTNGIGLVLALSRPAQVFSAEHFCVGFQSYACTAAPVRHPVTRAVIGVLDVTTKASAINPHTFAMVVHAARAMERDMEEHVFGRERELLERYLRGRIGLEVPFFTVDRSGRTIIQNAAAAQMLRGDDLSSILVLVREALHSGKQLECDLELNSGRVELSCHIVHAYEDVIGAGVSLRPVRRRHGASPATSQPGWPPPIGSGPVMRSLLEQAERVSARCVSAVIVGEPGTGKMMLARAMHQGSSRAQEPAVVVNFAQRGWRDELAASAGCRTLILRRAAALPEVQQLEVAAAVESLHQADVWTLTIVTDKDRMRLELLHRLAHTQLLVPPLRERMEDLALLVTDWCQRQRQAGELAPLVSPSAVDALRRHHWPGNIRELLNVLAAARLQSSGRVIERSNLSLASVNGECGGHGHATALRDIEREAIEHALAQTRGNVSRAAGLLGVSRATLHRRLREYRLLGH